MTFEEWKEKHSDLIENVAITFFNYERGVDTKTCFDELEYLLKRAFNAGRPSWHKIDELKKDNDKVQEVLDKQIEATYRVIEELDKAKLIIKKLSWDIRNRSYNPVKDLDEAEAFLKEAERYE